MKNTRNGASYQQKLNKESLHYQIFGKKGGQKLIFLHGLMGFGGNWRKITPAFADEFEILLLDQRGHGRSFHALDGYSHEHYSEDLLNLLNHLNWAKVSIIGHSMGGRHGLNLAYRCPERVSHLVLEDIGPAEIDNHTEEIRKMITRIPVPFSDRDEAKAYFQSDFIQNNQQTDQAAELGHFLFANLVEKEDGLNWRFHFDGILTTLDEAIKKDRWHEWVGLKVRTLILRGQKSKYLTSDKMKKMLATQPLSQGLEIPGAGHWIHYEKPQEFIHAVKEFLLK